MLGEFFNSKLTFQSHIDNSIKKGAYKLNAISRITPFMDFNKRKLFVNAFFKCSSYEELLAKDKSVSIHHKNIHALVIEMFKVYNRTSPEIKQEVFQIKDQGHYFIWIGKH